MWRHGATTVWLLGFDNRSMPWLCAFFNMYPYASCVICTAAAQHQIHTPPMCSRTEVLMVSCYLRYIVDPHKLEEFEAYAKMWIRLVEKFGGKHHGYFLPHEGPNNIAIAIFSFSSLATYEEYRNKARSDSECQAAMAYYDDTRCFVSVERSFMRPLFE